MKTEEIQDIICKNLGPCGRMISGSKSFYYSKCQNNFVVFNANLVLSECGKIWYGDLDITLDGNDLKKIAKEIGLTIYVLREMDARFGSEDDPIETLIKKAVWNTSEEVKKP